MTASEAARSLSLFFSRALLMNATSFFAGFVVLASSLAAVGCASEPSEPVAAESAELLTCTPAKYEEALAQYKNAVAWSKERLEHGICETEHGYLMTIADEAS